MPSANGHDRRRHDRRRRRQAALFRLLDSYHRLNAQIGWAGLFLLLLLFAANHRHGWFTR